MCVFNTLSEKAAVSCATSFYKVTTHEFMQKNSSQLYLEPAVNFLFVWQDEINQRLADIKKNDEMFYNFISYPVERVNKLREFERNLGPSSEKKKGEILEEEKKLIKEVIGKLHIKHDGLDGIKPESVRVFHESLNAGWRYWQTLQQEQDEIRPIFDPYAKDFLMIENYEKKLEKCKYYEGFYFHTTGKWKFSIKDKNDKEIFSHKSPILCLEQKKENGYYPHKYMVLCIDFQMENGGTSVKEAYKALEAAFAFYFQNIFKEKDGLETVSEIVENKNIWKDTFIELSGIGKNLRGVRKKDHTYNWKPGTGVSSD
jgi:hypothetical protein